jgi:hypothetical protein
MSRYSSIGWHDEPEESGSIIAFRYPVILSILLFVIGKYILPSGPLSIWPTARPTTGLRQSYTLIGMEKISSTSSWKIAQSNEEYCVVIQISPTFGELGTVHAPVEEAPSLQGCQAIASIEFKYL